MDRKIETTILNLIIVSPTDAICNSIKSIAKYAV